MDSHTETIARDDARHRYILRTEDGTEAGYIEFHEDGRVIDMPHTIVDPKFEGRGYGTKLVRFALDDARGRGLKVKPTCPFIARYIDKHEEYQDLLA